MRITREVMIGDRTVTVKELTTGEIRVWMAGLEAQLATPDLVGLLLIDGVSLADLKVMSDLDDAGLEDLTPSEIQSLLAAAKEVNADFFRMRERIEQLAALPIPGGAGRNSNVPSVP